MFDQCFSVLCLNRTTSLKVQCVGFGDILTLRVVLSMQRESQVAFKYN